MFYIDPLYFIIVGPAMLLALVAQFWVKSAYGRASRLASRRGMTGAQAARRILDNNHLTNIGVEESHRGELSDHYDPEKGVLRLSHDVYHGHSLAAVGIAAHEAGHAIQHAVAYAPLRMRTMLVPLAATGSNFSFLCIFAGMILMSMGAAFGQIFLLAGIGLFAATVVFQVVNLPVEFDASRRAKLVLVDYGIVSADEMDPVRKVLTAAAMTYVAATISAIATLLYFLLRSGLLGGRN
jgi:hypothetical protein